MSSHTQSQGASVWDIRALQHGNHIQINSENIFTCHYKIKGHFPFSLDFSIWMRAVKGRDTAKLHLVQGYRGCQNSDDGNIELYTFWQLGGLFRTDFEKTNFHVFVTISILIKYTEIESSVDSNTEGDTLLWFLRKKSLWLWVTSKLLSDLPNTLLIEASFWDRPPDPVT